MSFTSLWTEVHDILESFTKTQNPDANESHSGRHIQNSKPDSIFESEHGLGKNDEAGGTAAETDNLRSLPKRELPLGIVLDACPDIADMAQGGGIRHWRDFLAAVEVARPMLGVSPSAWLEACEAMGEVQAGDCAGGNPAAVRSDQQRRRVSAQPDRQGEGGPVLDLADGHGAFALQARCGQDERFNPELRPPETDHGEAGWEVSDALLKDAQETKIVTWSDVTPLPCSRQSRASRDGSANVRPSALGALRHVS
jgi:hypothetical protein